MVTHGHTRSYTVYTVIHVNIRTCFHPYKGCRTVAVLRIDNCLNERRVKMQDKRIEDTARNTTPYLLRSPRKH